MAFRRRSENPWRAEGRPCARWPLAAAAPPRPLRAVVPAASRAAAAVKRGNPPLSPLVLQAPGAARPGGVDAQQLMAAVQVRHSLPASRQAPLPSMPMPALTERHEARRRHAAPLTATAAAPGLHASLQPRCGILLPHHLLPVVDGPLACLVACLPACVQERRLDKVGKAMHFLHSELHLPPGDVQRLLPSLMRAPHFVQVGWGRVGRRAGSQSRLACPEAACCASGSSWPLAPCRPSCSLHCRHGHPRRTGCACCAPWASATPTWRPWSAARPMCWRCRPRPAR